MEIKSVRSQIEMDIKSTMSSLTSAPRPHVLVQFQGHGDQSEFIRFHVSELSYCIDQLEDMLQEMQKPTASSQK